MKLGMAGSVSWAIVGFWVQAEFVGVEKVRAFAAVTYRAPLASTATVERVARIATELRHQRLRRIVCVSLSVRRASFSKPSRRRIERRSARGFAGFMRRFLTRRPEPSLAR